MSLFIVELGRQGSTSDHCSVLLPESEWPRGYSSSPKSPSKTQPQEVSFIIHLLGLLSCVFSKMNPAPLEKDSGQEVGV